MGETGKHNFKPPIWMRASAVQTALAGLKFRGRKDTAMKRAARPRILDCGDGVRLLASVSLHTAPKGTIVFLHGWEGSQDSTYVVACGSFLYEAGYNVVRVNYRDNGDSHYLNEGLFYAGRFTEVFNAVRHGCNVTPDLPAYVVGFSLGGNFALRVLRETKITPIDNLAHVFSISPVIDPLKASPVVDERNYIRKYFVKKWRRSLRKKQAFFPQTYDFTDVLTVDTIMEMSEILITNYMNFQGQADFFNAYRLWPDDLISVTMPGSIIMAKFDPVLPAEDIYTLNLPDNIERIMLPYGGHNGFFDSIFGPTWYDKYILETIC